jgi:hypothetical protein
MSATTRRRLDALQAARSQQEKRKGGNNHVENIRKLLQRLDGQADIGVIPGEGLYDEMVRRLQVADGYDLSLMPGDTLQDKKINVEPAYYGKIVVSPEARHAARGFFQLYDYV